MNITLNCKCGFSTDTTIWTSDDPVQVFCTRCDSNDELFIETETGNVDIRDFIKINFMD